MFVFLNEREFSPEYGDMQHIVIITSLLPLKNSQTNEDTEKLNISRAQSRCHFCTYTRCTLLLILLLAYCLIIFFVGSTVNLLISDIFICIVCDSSKQKHNICLVICTIISFKAWLYCYTSYCYINISIVIFVMARGICKAFKKRKGVGGRGKKKVDTSNRLCDIPNIATPSQPSPTVAKELKPPKVTSSKKKIDFSEYDKYEYESDPSYKNEIIDISILSEQLLQNTLCKNCKQNGLQISSENRVGLASKLVLFCYDNI